MASGQKDSIERGENLEKLAESFSSDVINEAISEIIAEEDLKEVDGNKWYRDSKNTTPTREVELSMQEEYSVSTGQSLTQRTSLEKVSPIASPKERSLTAGSSLSSRRQIMDSTSDDEPLPTSEVLKSSEDDIPGYISPQTRNKILTDGGVAPPAMSSVTAHASLSEETLKTMVYDAVQDSMFGDDTDRKTSATSFSSTSRDDSRDSSKSYSRRQSETGNSSVGSATVYNSIAGDVFGHKRHLSPLLDMSERSIELERTLNEERRKAEQLLASESSSARTTPRDKNYSGTSPRYGTSPRDQQSRMSSGTEYDPLPQSMRESKLSPNISAQLMLSPDLAQRVSAILNPTGQSPDIPKLSFTEDRTIDTHRTYHSLSPRSPHAVLAEPSPREHDSGRAESASGSSHLSSDELDRHVSRVLSRSGGRDLHASPPGVSGEGEVSGTGEQQGDLSYLDKYMSPRYIPPRTGSRPSSRQHSRPESRAYTSPREALRLESRSKQSPRQRENSRPSSRSTESYDDVDKKYMDKTSRDVLEQAAKEYYTDLKRSKYDADESVHGRSSQNRNNTMTTTSDVNEELAQLANKSHSPASLSRPGSRCKPLEVVRYNTSPRSSPPQPPVVRETRPARQVTAMVTEAETQSIVAKRLDRIEFMVLSALNEVPPQSRESYPPASEQDDTIQRSPSPSPDSTVYEDLRDAIKTAAPRSPLASLPQYSMIETGPGSRQLSKEESFNISISPVKRDPFSAFNRAHEMLADRLAQRANERTPGRRLSTRSNIRSPARSPTRDSYHPYHDSISEARSRSKEKTPSGLENIPEPRTLEIEAAGKSPSEEMLLTRHRKASMDDSVTTAESTHTESDDAEPPRLPKECLGSRKEPVKPSPGIYGTRTKSTTSKSPRTEPDEDVEETNTRQESAQPERSAVNRSAVNRAEKALQRGNQIRERLIAERNNRNKEQQDKINPVELLNPSSPERRRSRRSYRSTGRRQDEEEARYTQDADADEEAEDKETSHRAYLDDSTYPGGENLHKSVVLDFYTPPRPKPRARKSLAAQRRKHDENGLVQEPPVAAWEDERHNSEHIKDTVGERHLGHTGLERAMQMRDQSLERAVEARQRSAERAIQRSAPPPTHTYKSRSQSRSPPRSRSPVTIHQRSPSPQDRVQRDRTEALLHPLERVDDTDSYPPVSSALVRPLECPTPEAPEDRDIRSRLSHALSDRQRTYHILREELMKTEDEVKGRELNTAWQRISKRKPKTPDPTILDDSTTTTVMTDTSAASSEFFDEERMNKLKHLLNNPLAHLINKTKRSKRSKPSHAEPNVSQKSQMQAKSQNSKYEQLMNRIDRQRVASESEEISSTTVASTDDTMCSKCEIKRNAKRTAIKHPDTRNVGAKHNTADSTVTPDSNISEEDEEYYKSSSTRPVTPTGLPTPHIKSTSRSTLYNVNNNQAQSRPEKRLKDAGVMCPSPTMKIKMCQEDTTQTYQVPAKDNKYKQHPVEKKKDKEALAWFVGEEPKHPQRNAFQKARHLDHQDGLVWFVPYGNPRPWNKPARERKALSVSKEPWMPDNQSVQTAKEKRALNDLCNAFNEATGRTKYTPTLQEAFRERNQRFVSQSRERQRRIKLRADEREINKVHDEQRAKLFDIQPSSYRLTSRSSENEQKFRVNKRAIPKDEMYDRTSRVYNALPEVKNKEKVNSTQQERVANRLKAKLFNKRVQRRVLDHARVTNLVGKNKKPNYRRGTFITTWPIPKFLSVEVT